MRMVICGECKKRYDFDKDDFCPRCGAFNPPAKQYRVDNYGNVVRSDGVNESNHSGSFVHSEVHREKVVRRIKGLDRDAYKPASVLQSGRKKKPATAGRSNRKKELAYWIGAIIAALGLLFEILYG